MDAWIWRQAGKPYDKDAEWARAGKVILPLLQNMLSDSVFLATCTEKYRTRIL